MVQEKKKEVLEILDKIFYVAKCAEITYIENQVLKVFEIINSTEKVEFDAKLEEIENNAKKLLLADEDNSKEKE